METNENEIVKKEQSDVDVLKRKIINEYTIIILFIIGIKFLYPLLVDFMLGDHVGIDSIGNALAIAILLRGFVFVLSLIFLVINPIRILISNRKYIKTIQNNKRLIYIFMILLPIILMGLSLLSSLNISSINSYILDMFFIFFILQMVIFLIIMKIGKVMNRKTLIIILISIIVISIGIVYCMPVINKVLIEKYTINYLNKKYGDNDFKIVDYEVEYLDQENILSVLSYRMKVSSSVIDDEIMIIIKPKNVINVENVYDNFMEQYYNVILNDYFKQKSNLSFRLSTHEKDIPSDIGHIPTIDELTKVNAISIYIEESNNNWIINDKNINDMKDIILDLIDYLKITKDVTFSYIVKGLDGDIYSYSIKKSSNTLIINDSDKVKYEIDLNSNTITSKNDIVDETNEIYNVDNIPDDEHLIPKPTSEELEKLKMPREIMEAFAAAILNKDAEAMVEILPEDLLKHYEDENNMSYKEYLQKNFAAQKGNELEFINIEVGNGKMLNIYEVESLNKDSWIDLEETGMDIKEVSEGAMFEILTTVRYKGELDQELSLIFVLKYKGLWVLYYY